MFKEIIIKKFRSYRNEVVFTMEANDKRVSEYKDSHITKINSNNLLKISLLYGPNGGGKTNLLQAIIFIRTIVLNGSLNLPPRELSNIFNSEDPIELTIYFVDEEYEYGYKIVFNTKIVEDNNLFINNKNYKLNVENLYETLGFRKDDGDFKILYEREENGSSNGLIFDDLGNKIPQLSISKTLLNKLYEDYADNDTTIESLKIVKNIINHFENIEILRIEKEIPFVEESA